MADGLTKVLQSLRFLTFVDQLGMVDILNKISARDLPEVINKALLHRFIANDAFYAIVK